MIVDGDLTAALTALRAVARRSSVARRLQGAVEERLLQSIVDATASLFDAEASSIALFETDPARLEFRVAAGVHGAGDVGLQVKPTEGIATRNSFAAPHVAGMVALIMSKHPGLAPLEVKAVLAAVADNPRRPTPADPSGPGEGR